MVMREARSLFQSLKLALGFAGCFGAGVAPRVLTPTYTAVDLGLEGCLLGGMVGGYVTGLLSGVLISLPAFFNGELMSMLLLAGVGVLGGLLRDLPPDKEEMWRFSPLLDVSFYPIFKGQHDLRPTAYQLAVLAAIVFCQLL